MYESVKEFGEKVLEYLLSISDDDDTILFAIDDDIYRSEIFNDDQTKIDEFEKEIKQYVSYNGLNYQNYDNIALALAAHQIKLAYDSRLNAYDINTALVGFYYPREQNNILYQSYYKSLNTTCSENLQDLLWKRIGEILKDKHRSHTIPSINDSGNKEQKYITSQVFVYNSIKNYFKIVFYEIGISKKEIYNKDSFIEKITKSKYAIEIINRILKEINSKFTQFSYINFKINDKLIYFFLWNFYLSWDGQLKTYEGDSNQGFQQETQFLELFEGQDQKFILHKTQPNLTLNIDPANGVFYRLFTSYSEDFWQIQSESMCIPENESFVLIISKNKLDIFSSVLSDAITYKSDDKNDEKYIALKFQKLPSNFYDISEFCDVKKNNNSVAKIIGGLRIHNNFYINIEKENLRQLLLPKVNVLNPECKISERSVQANEIKQICILKNEEKIANYTLIDYKPVDKSYTPIRSNMNGLSLTSSAAEKIINKNIQDNILKLHFKGYINKNENKISYENLYILLDKNSQSVNDCNILSKEEKEKLYDGIEFGNLSDKISSLVSDDDKKNINSVICNNISEIEFSVMLNPTSFKSKYQIKNFEIIEGDKILSKGGLRKELKGKTFNYEANNVINQNKVHDYKIININYDLKSELQKDFAHQDFEKELSVYQEGFYLWLSQKGFATWPQIHNACCIMTENSSFRENYRACPEYKIFIPLYKVGLFIYCTDDEGREGYSLSNKIHLINNIESDYSYMNHFAGTNVMDKKTVKDSAFEFLKKSDSIIQMIEKFSEDSLNQPTTAFITYDWKHLHIKPDNIQSLNIQGPCIFKYQDMPWAKNYICLKNGKRFIIDTEDKDSINICYSYINAYKAIYEQGKKLFEYDPENKILKCNYFPSVPIVYARPLLLQNVEKLQNNELYLAACKNHWSQLFANIDEEFVKELDNKYSENIKEK